MQTQLKRKDNSLKVQEMGFLAMKNVANGRLEKQ